MVGPNMITKSIAWTRRGWEAAAKEAIYVGWQFHSDVSGVLCPWGVEELRETFAAPLGAG